MQKHVNKVMHSNYFLAFTIWMGIYLYLINPLIFQWIQVDIGNGIDSSVFFFFSLNAMGILVILIAYPRHVYYNNQIKHSTKVMWIGSFFLGGPISMTIYWVRYLKKSTNKKQIRVEKGSHFFYIYLLLSMFVLIIAGVKVRQLILQPINQEILFTHFELPLVPEIYAVNEDGTNMIPLTNSNPEIDSTSPWMRKFYEFFPTTLPSNTNITVGEMRSNGQWQNNSDGIIFVAKNQLHKIHPITLDISKISEFSINGGVSFSSDDNQIVIASKQDENINLYTSTYPFEYFAQITYSEGSELSPDWSPINNQIVFASDMNGEWNIYIIDSDGINLVNLTPNSESNTSPRWSNNGTKIAYLSKVNGSTNIMIYDLTTKKSYQITDNLFSKVNPVWSPDDSQILFGANRIESSSTQSKIHIIGDESSPSQFDLYTLDLETNEIIQLTNTSASEFPTDWR